MLQPDDVVHDGCHRLARGFGVAVGHGYGDFFVAAENDLRVGLTPAFIIDQGIVDPAKARAGI
jgi:hypothetical protein